MSQTGDHLGRKGMGWGGGVGVLVGLAAPPLLASVAVGAAAGGIVGKFAKHKVDSGLEEGLGEKLKPGTAAIIAIIDEEHRLEAERALAGSPAKSVAPMDKHGLRGLKDALAEAAGKFVPDRTVLPIPDKTFGGTAGRTLKHSVADWSFIPGPKAPEEAPNVLVVLIDDAGFGSIDSFGGPVSTPAFSRVQDMGITYNRFHVTAVCSPTRAALLTGRNQHRVGFGSIAEYPGPFPGYSASKPRVLRRLPPHPQGERLRHRRLRQVAPHAGQRARARPVRSTTGPSPGASTTGGASSAAQPASTTPSSLRTTGRSACPRARTASSTTSPTTSPTRQWSGCTRSAPRMRTSRGWSSTPPAAPTPRTMWPPSGPTSTRASSTTAGTRCASARWRGRRSSASCRRTPSSRNVRTPSPPGIRSPTTRRSSTCARWRSTAATRRTPTGTSAACWIPSRRWATSTTPSSSTSGATTAPAWKARPPVRSTRRRSSTASCSTRSSSSLSSTSTGASRRSAATTRRLTSQPRGRTPATPRSSGASSRPATSAAPATRWS